MSDHNAELKQFFIKYMNEVDEKGISGIAPYFLYPLSVFSPNGMATIESTKQLEDYFTPMVETLNAQGYDHMEAAEINTKELGDNLAIASNVVVRYKEDGSELNRNTGNYLLYKGNEGWKIGSLLIGEADKVIRF